jgi:hypothetical protein
MTHSTLAPEPETDADATFRNWMRLNLARAAETFGLAVTGTPVFGWRLRSIGAVAHGPDGDRWLRVVSEQPQWATGEFWTGNQDAKWPDPCGVRPPPQSAAIMLAVKCYHGVMERTQVSLTSEQMAGLRRRARERDMSIAALLREAVDNLLLAEQRDQAVELALSAIGGFRSTTTDNISADHDRFLDEIYGS